jgi:hypothetical protein
MIRFNLTVTEQDKTFDFRFIFKSSLTIDQFEIQKLFISSLGDNFPCSTMSNQAVNKIYNGYVK